MKTTDDIRREFAAAREDYLKDMTWLREEFGMIPDVQEYAMKEMLLASFRAIEANDVPSLTKAVQQFKLLHNDVLAHVTWKMLEQTKRCLKEIRDSHPDDYKAKHQLWLDASWAYTHGKAFQRDTAAYRTCIQILASI